MSFQDLFHDVEAGLPPRPPPRPPQAVVAHCVFQINTKVSALGRLADALTGGGGDARAIRERIRRTRAEVTRLARNTARKLADPGAAAAVGPRLASDFEAALRGFQRMQQRIIAADRQETAVAAYRTPSGPETYPSNGALTSVADQHRTAQAQQLVESSRTQELVLLDDEISFNEALVEEREREIGKILHEITEISEIVRDLGKLVHGQQEAIDIVESNLETAAMETSKGHEQISKAAATQQSVSSMKCLLMTVLGLFLFIVVVVLSA